MTYPVWARNRGWLWEHRAVVAAVCLVVLAADSLVGLGLVPFLPLGMLLIAAGMSAAVVLVVLVFLWLSATASDVPPDAKPTI